MDENKKEKIKEEAKRILDKFAKALESVNLKKKEFKKASEGYRNEGNGSIENGDFRKRMFANAAQKDDEYIIAESKKW